MRKCSPEDINENGGELDDLVGVVHSVLLLARGFEVHYHQVVESSEFSTDYKRYRYCPKREKPQVNFYSMTTYKIKNWFLILYAYI